MNHLGLPGCLSGQYRELSRISESRDVARGASRGRDYCQNEPPRTRWAYRELSHISELRNVASGAS